MNRLKVSSSIHVLFDMVRDRSGRIRSQCTTKDMEEAVDRWITFGLDEYVGTGIDVYPRHTNSTSEHFLPRLKAYLESQFPEFTYEVFDDA